MIAVIGEMAISFSADGGAWKREYTGLGYEWAVHLRERGVETALLSILPMGRIGEGMADELGRRGILFDPDLRLPLNPMLRIDGEWIMKGSAPFALSVEKLGEALSRMNGMTGVVVSSRLLSANPASSAVLDALSFLSPRPRIAIDTSPESGTLSDAAVLARTLDGFRASVPEAVISSSEAEISGAVR